MSALDTILRLFPELTAKQQDHFRHLGTLYPQWNEKVNLISRTDIGHLYERHVLHSLAIGLVHRFPAGSRVVDMGTGGGFPGVPLAVLFPESRFHLIDGVGKKISAVQGVIADLGLTNVTAEKVRSEQHKERYDIIVSRAVAALPALIKSTRHLVPQGKGLLLCLKGGQLADEVMPVHQPVRIHELSKLLPGEFFAEKKVVEVEL